MGRKLKENELGCFFFCKKSVYFFYFTLFRTASAVRMGRDESSSKHARMGVRRSGGALEKKKKESKMMLFPCFMDML